MEPERLIFLGGSPRSGTTLVQNMLDSHPDVVGGPEFLHLPDIAELYSKLNISVGKGWIDLFCDAESLRREIRELVMRFLLPLADAQGARYLSEKTPENVLAFPLLAELFPESKFLFVVRDPRATVASQLAVGERARSKGEQPAHFTTDVMSSARYVRACLSKGFRAVKEAPDRVYTLVYERLVQEPEAQARQLCEFLGLPWADELLRPGEKQHLGEAAITSASNNIWYDKDTYYSNPNTASLEKWRSQLSPAQQLIVNREFHNNADLKALGYEFAPPEISGSRALGAQLKQQQVRISHGLKKRLTGWLDS